MGMAIVRDDYSPHLTTKLCRRVATRAPANHAEIVRNQTNSSRLNRRAA
ncbi:MULTISPECIES: hypothetical protein [Streptomyces]|uniref:Transposase n=1 Tax=Streptomyces stelliscabiei TaxID=146820 RepID=A0A8I0PAU1_9ACTN|nr:MULTISPECIES: hypothetical protein [Streptomyces]MBE1602683.1 hypothetical protein [Streptomyces stelliscabiei]MDX2516889.1 hypothetical protein [Streptomyces stelliscabiei]MDX2550632.1 hypothetical protein [Streptomyces stelliscabiei]MDX2610330.1 hypothetical protein [Streptomyces stelliscabiei]MDX2634749.1 hypothetical protein [Streptomyces stelliscabiei]